MNNETIVKNFVTINQYIREAREKHNEALERIKALERVNTMQSEQLGLLKHSVATLQAQVRGTGPTA